jgi:hypothetical protein
LVDAVEFGWLDIKHTKCEAFKKLQFGLLERLVKVEGEDETNVAIGLAA